MLEYIASQVVECMGETGTSLEELSGKTGLSISVLEKIIFAEYDLTVHDLYVIMNALGYETRIIIKGDSITINPVLRG